VSPHGRQRAGTAVLAALSLLCGWLALRPDSSGAAVETAPRPVWTPERLPAVLAEAQGSADLERAVDELLAQSGARSCVAVYEGDRPVLLRRIDQPLIPASTQKILVGAALLAELGPDFRFETKVVSDGPPRDGAVGTLWLVGSGDPLLATPEYALWLKDRPRYRLRQPTPLAALADALRGAGVQAVTGSILGDDSRYDRTRILPGWKASYVIDNEAGPLGALLVNGGFTVYDPSQAADAAAAGGTPPVPPGEQRADEPAVHTASELTRLVAAAGIGVAGPAGAGTPPTGAQTLATVRSAPLSEIVAAMLRESDNTAAELLVRELGVVKAGDGSTPAGTKVVAEALAAARLPTGGLYLADGSGLDVANRATCDLLAGALRRPDPRNSGGPELSPLLAVAGQSGTLSRRLADTPLAGKLRGKTGSLNGVTGRCPSPSWPTAPA
jgi:D-alanyl-D-alanine carboxypeptidase/D-alanyl-D-alanine-endopeptidase (penicillin-binding protein 4)